MLQRLELTNFTVFRDAKFDFGKGLNVIHGTNGTGKSHVLKVAYLLQHALASPPSTSTANGPSKSAFQRALAEELVEVFRPDKLGRLVTRAPGRSRAEVAARFKKKGHRTAFGFHTASKSEVKLEQTPVLWLEKPPVFLPTREALTIYPGFVSLYDTHTIEFSRVWRDLCVLLGAPLARGPRAATTGRLLAVLERAMGGKILLDRSGRFYLADADRGTIEMHLVAEGIRKLATVARLIATGGLAEKGCLLWDEPDANLNPSLIVDVAKVLFALARQGIQVFIATHSLFLMRELEILQSQAPDEFAVRYFGLQPTEDGTVDVEQGPTIADSGDISALEGSLEQSERYLALDGP